MTGLPTNLTPRAVLGIDAAWTTHNPSGVAVARDTGTGWRLVAAASSFSQFYDQPDAPAHFDADRILAAATRHAGIAPDLVAIDMPLADTLITARRVSDNLISARYGARGAGTHSPSALRPGPLALDMLTALAAQDYPLHCAGPLTGKATVEVYPHPALIELTGAPRRLPYKIAKRAKYSPDLTSAARIDAIFGQWSEILARLETVLPGTIDRLPLPDPAAPIRSLKGFEDKLDAVICAWIGTSILDGRATPYGDATGAIWVPHAP